MFEPIEQVTITERVAKQILDQLANRTLKPGDRLPPERILADQLHVGRTTVREALKLLTLSGLLEARRGDGTYVRENFQSFLSQQVEWPILLSARQVDMILEVRQPLELQAAFLAAERATLAEIETIARFRELAEVEGRDIALETSLDLAFHNAIATASHNDLLTGLMLSLQTVLQQYMELANEMTDSVGATLKEHQTIYEAIRDHDPVAAQAAMREHLTQSKTMILKAFYNGDAQ